MLRPLLDKARPRPPLPWLSLHALTPQGRTSFSWTYPEMRLPLGLEPRRGASVYVETFILIGIAVGGSAIVYSAMGGYASSAGGPSVAVSGALLRQGSSTATERLLVTNTGTTPFTSFTVVTARISSTPSYCITLQSSSGGSMGFASPPLPCGSGTTANPGSITLSPSNTIPPGQSVILTLVIYSSSEFSIGRGYTITVATSGGAQQEIVAAAIPG